MRVPVNAPWGKIRRPPDGEAEWHPLVDHGRDVAACAEALLRHPTTRRRLSALAGVTDLPDVWIDRIAVLALLHDFGKANSGFQRRSRPGTAPIGHIDETATVLCRPDLLQALGFDRMDGWGSALDQGLLAVLAHHGRPADVSDPSAHALHWEPDGGYDPAMALRDLAAAAKDAYRPAYEAEGPPLPQAPAFWHAVAGLLMLADWLGSDDEAFSFTTDPHSNRMAVARSRARDLLAEIGFDPLPFRRGLPADIGFDKVSSYKPSEIQRMAADAPGPIVVLEAETGSGKTEAALFRFARLFAAGKVDGLYFALPTRVAASALYERVSTAVERMFGDGPHPTIIQAVPGYVRADGAQARRLPGFEVQWSDDPNDAARRARWAAENPKRFLAGTIVVGTIDQALLGTVAVRHAHLRAFSLLRSLLVVDEVHASDAYMEGLLVRLLELHAEGGGEALLLSATLGAGARTRLLLQPPCAVPAPEAAVATPYPSLSFVEDKRIVTEPAAGRGKRKTVGLTVDHAIADPQAIALRALAAAKQGAKVLVVRNTVRDAVAVVRSLVATSPGHPALFRVRNVPTLHHGRFAREDRVLLDAEVEAALGHNRSPGGLILVGTQTLEQSLDIDADLLITDLAPVDVLLQRLGRLHRHDHSRPPGFEATQAIVLVPPDLSSALARVSAGRSGPHGLGGSVYDDLVALEATRLLVEGEPVWDIPAMNRRLVEQGTHPALLQSLVDQLTLIDGRWRKVWLDTCGRRRAAGQAAGFAAIDWQEPFSDFRLNEEAIGTRLGLRDAVIDLEGDDWVGPFGERIARIIVPGWWHDVVATLAAGARPVEKVPEAAGFSFRIDQFVLRYGPYGLERLS